MSKFDFDNVSGPDGIVLAEVLEKLQNGKTVKIQLEFMTIQQSVESALERGIEPDYRLLANAQREGKEGVGIALAVEGDVLDLAVLLKLAFQNNPGFYKLCKSTVSAYEQTYHPEDDDDVFIVTDDDDDDDFIVTDHEYDMLNSIEDSGVDELSVSEMLTVMKISIKLEAVMQSHGGLVGYYDSINNIKDRMRFVEVVGMIKTISDRVKND